ncbi:MAG: M1 family metallopeptidase [Saprospiraceae bacterium]|nr:M1 family metallopeptidase [Saprospiraceae bacterium]
MGRWVFSSIILLIFSLEVWSQDQAPLSDRVAHYTMDVTLDHKTKKAKCRQQLRWVNKSPDTLSEMRFYMYLNAFKNLETTFLKNSRGNVFGQDISERGAESWGWIEINRLTPRSEEEWTDRLHYIQPNDGNPKDQSIVSLSLPEPLLPGDTIELDIYFLAKMPQIIARAGYSKDDYFLFVHWFPQPGVYEQDINGEWGWNCHQFFPGTEFYADFGVYEFNLTASDHLIIGASGVRTNEVDNGDGTRTIQYLAEDVIDFAWVAYPYFEEYHIQWNHVDIRLLIPPEHCMLKDRYLTAAVQGLEYMTEHVGKYPYPSLTIVDPPLHALRSGLMEYPMLITCGSFYRMPDNIRTLESLVIHEFVHQYFMATVATNEKEEAWMDEGLVTYYEDKIMDHYYGENCSLYDVLGYRSGNSENSRQEYTQLPNPSIGTTARPGWEIKTGYKGLVYSKTAGMLRTIEGLMGTEAMDEMMQLYYDTWKFKHPKGPDFIQLASTFAKEKSNLDLNPIFEQCLYGTELCDYAVRSISNEQFIRDVGLFDEGDEKVFKGGYQSDGFYSQVVCDRLGGLIFPQEIEVTFSDGSKIIEYWSGKERRKVFEYEGDKMVVSAHLDPQRKIYLDVNFNNNSFTFKLNRKPMLKYTAKAIHWLQNVLQFSSFIM